MAEGCRAHLKPAEGTQEPHASFSSLGPEGTILIIQGPRSPRIRKERSQDLPLLINPVLSSCAIPLPQDYRCPGTSRSPVRRGCSARSWDRMWLPNSALKKMPLASASERSEPQRLYYPSSWSLEILQWPASPLAGDSPGDGSFLLLEGLMAKTHKERPPLPPCLLVPTSVSQDPLCVLGGL